MAKPVDDPSGSNELTDPTVRVVPLSELRATVAELMKEAAEAQKERQPRPDDPGKSQTGRVTVLSLGNTSEMTGLRPPPQGGGPTNSGMARDSKRSWSRYPRRRRASHRLT